MMKTAGLIRFLKGTSDPKAGMPGCSNYDFHYGGCLFADTCLVEQGERCSFFEIAVLPLGNDSIRQRYEDLTGYFAEGITVNLCGGCGDRIQPRRRFCDKCSRKRRQKTKRESQRKFRGKQRVSA